MDNYESMITLDDFQLSMDVFQDLCWLADELEKSIDETLTMLIHDAVVRRRKRIIVRENKHE